MGSKFKYPKGWKFPGGYYEDGKYIKYTGVDDPKFIESQEEFIKSHPNGWWFYVRVPDKYRPEIFKSKFDRFKGEDNTL